MKKNKKYVYVSLAIVVAIIAFFLSRGGDTSSVSSGEEAKGDPTEIVVNFYDTWLTAKKATSTTPFKEGLAKSFLLSKDLKSELKKKENDAQDPVLCQSDVAELTLATQPLGVSDTEARYVIMPSTRGLTSQAIVTMLKEDDVWHIATIECSGGEFAPEREFTFEQSGILAKDSLPASYSRANWYLLYTENDTVAIVPLIMSKTTTCTKAGAATACTDKTFFEGLEVSVKGQMTEVGAEVAKVELK